MIFLQSTEIILLSNFRTHHGTYIYIPQLQTQCAAQAKQRYKSKYKKVGVLPIRIVQSNVSSIGPSSEILIIFLFLSDEGPMLETLVYTIRIGSTPTFLYFDLYLYIFLIPITLVENNVCVVHVCSMAIPQES